MKHTDPLPHPQRWSPYSSCSSHSFYSWVTLCHRESNLGNLHYFGLPGTANVLQHWNVGHIIQASNDLLLRCQNLKVGMCVMRRLSQYLERNPRHQPSPASILRAVQFKSNSYGCRSITGDLRPGLWGCKTWIHLLRCLCELLRFDSSQTFPRTLFSGILVRKRILTFSHLCWENRAAFTLHARSALKQVSDAPKTPQEVKNPSPKQESKVVSTTRYHIYSMVQTHGITARQGVTYSVYIPSLKQADSNRTVTNYLKTGQNLMYRGSLNYLYFVLKGRSTRVPLRQLLYFEENKRRVTVTGSVWCCCSLVMFCS